MKSKIKIRKCEIAAIVRTRKTAQCGITAFYQHNVDIMQKSYEKEQTGMVFVISHEDPEATILHDSCNTKQQFVDIVYDHVNSIA